ncbi:hypothetical protein [Nocardia blacklockiae]|uniref:hypothetical protein n=1 Tax=Nocardia blacklockiae TaxID=480036 RepID=UPI001895C9E5|nr:hypothetical protein [Nocardia blacklockiae]MBF6176029.1 hypothetical protein [Nocardia blacklockiae]
MAVLAIMGLVYIPYTLDHAARGDTAGVVFGIAAMPMAAAFVVALVPHMKVRWKNLPRTTRIAVVDGGAVGLRCELRGWVRAMIAIWLLTCVAFLAVVVWGSMADAAQTRDPQDSVWAAVGNAVPIMVGVGCVGFIVHFLAGRRKRFYCAFTPDGVVQRSGTTTQILAWDDIAAIEPITEYHVRKIRINPKTTARVTVSGRRTLAHRLQSALLSLHIDLTPTGHGLDPALMFHLATFYWRNPTARAELGCERVIDRITTGAIGA